MEKKSGEVEEIIKTFTLKKVTEWLVKTPINISKEFENQISFQISLIPDDWV